MFTAKTLVPRLSLPLSAESRCLPFIIPIKIFVTNT